MGRTGECAGIRPQLGVYVTGAIARADHAALVRHLASCERYPDELVGLAALPSGESAAAHERDAGEALLGRVLSRMAVRRRRRRWALATAAVVLAALATGERARDGRRGRDRRRRLGHAHRRLDPGDVRRASSLYGQRGHRSRPGQGNGLDASGGLWHEVTVSGAAAPASSPSPGRRSGGSGGGGYGYQECDSPVDCASRQAVKAGPSSLGMILTGAKGLAVYPFEKDTRTRPPCNGACATAWPPLLTTRGQPVAGSAARRRFMAKVRRSNGTTQ